MLRSTPCGRGGLLCGSSPLATRSVQSPKYLNGTPPSTCVSGFSMNVAACPDCTRRIHAFSPVSNCPSEAGIVRVESWPSWWQPTDRKSTRLNSSHLVISYAVFCLKKKKKVTSMALLLVLFRNLYSILLICEL